MTNWVHVIFTRENKTLVLLPSLLYYSSEEKQHLFKIFPRLACAQTLP